MQNKIVELDVMKFWGILLVVLIHITNMYTPTGLIRSQLPQSILEYIYYFIYPFLMPLFVFGSGCVYAYQCEVLNRKGTFLDLVKKKTSRLLIPYFVFGILMITLMLVLGLRGDIWDYALNGIILSKDSRHLWFVMMLFEVFVLFWIMYRCVEKLRLPKWSLLIFSFIFYVMAGYLPYVVQINMASRYLFWFTFGYVFLLHKQLIQKILNFYILGGYFCSFTYCTHNMFHIKYRSFQQ